MIVRLPKGGRGNGPFFFYSRQLVTKITKSFVPFVDNQ